MYKASQFNTYIEQDNGDLLVINSNSGKWVFIQNKTKEDFFTDMSSVEEFKTTYLDKLLKYKIIVKKNVQELDFADISYQDYVTDNKLSLLIIPVNDCNFRCKYCYETFNDRIMDDDVINRLEKYVDNSLHNKTSLNVIWFGGEPLLAFDKMEKIMKKFFAITRRQRKVFTQGIITNGYYLTPYVLKTLIDYKCMHIQVTLDGTEEIHNRYRYLKNKEGTFNTIINNLRYICDAITNKYLSITIRINITKDIVNNLSEYIRFLENEFQHDSRFKFLWRLASDWGGDSVDSMLEQIGDIDLLKNCFEKISKSTLNARAHMRLFRKCGSICDAAKKNHYVIDPDAKIFKCTMKVHDNEDINNIGYIDKNGIMLVNKEKEAVWRKQYYNKECEKCSFYISCYGMSCPAQRLYHSQKVCPYDKNLLEPITSIIRNTNEIIRLEDK